MTTTYTRISLGPSETGIHYHNKLSNLVPFKLLNKPSLLLEVGHSTVLYNVGSSNSTQGSLMMIFTCTCSCTTAPLRCLYQASLHLLPDSLHWVVCRCNCVIPSLMLWSLHPIKLLWALLQRRRRRTGITKNCSGCSNLSGAGTTVLGLCEMVPNCKKW